MKLNKIQILIIALFTLTLVSCVNSEKAPKRPNILFAISDDQSFVHTGFAGSNFIKTPAFDRVAAEGVFFTNCIAGSPGCAPSRSTIITGRYHWQNEQSGQHASSWMKKYVPFIDLLDANGYITGRTGKGVSPFQYARTVADSMWRKTDAGGIEYSSIKYEANTPNDERPANGIRNLNYFENFKYFIENKKGDQPFFFWYGANEPHRKFEQDSWKRTDKKLADATVPAFFPDHEIVRGDILDYAIEIEWFDLHLQRMINYLEKIGELENTIIIVTSDNGMAFPRAKANGYEYGIHVPFAIRFPKEFPGGRIVDDPLSFADLAPTILELTSTKTDGMLPISGESIVKTLKSGKQGIVDPQKKYVFTGRERHSSSRYKNRGYPMRTIRNTEFLLIWNMIPERWPAGAPQRIVEGTTNELWPMYGIDEQGIHHSDWAFTDIDAAPTKSYIIENKNDKTVQPYFELAHSKRPEFELYNIKTDEYCLDNLIGNQDFADVEKEMKTVLLQKLKETGDPRIVGPDKEIFDSYLRYSPIREFPKPEIE